MNDNFDTSQLYLSHAILILSGILSAILSIIQMRFFKTVLCYRIGHDKP